MHDMTPSLFKPIRLLLLDVDGVLTDGTLLYTEQRTETKAFSVKDGLGLRMLIRSGINAGIVTGRSSRALARRCKELGLSPVYDNVTDKGGLLEEILSQTGLPAGQVAFMGDDLPDICLLKKVGLAIAVADAHPAVREAADIVTAAPGGHGAVREVCEQMLRAQGRWEQAVQTFM